METVVLLQIISNVFWLILLVLIIVVFRRQLKALLDSLGRFDIAGTHFEFRDEKETLESYAVLSEVLLQILERRESVVPLVPLISDKSARRLATFTVQYAREVPEDDQELEMVLNVALLLGRKERYSDALEIAETRLKKHPNDLDANQQKALWLLSSRVPAKVRSADKILDRLVNLYPNYPSVWFNRALTSSLLGNYDQALSDLKQAIELHYWAFPKGREMLADPSLVA